MVANQRLTSVQIQCRSLSFLIPHSSGDLRRLVGVLSSVQQHLPFVVT